MIAAASVNEPLLLGVNVTGPLLVGVIVKVCGVAELLNVNTTGVDRPPPEGVIVTVPEYTAAGITVKLDYAVPTGPAAGPVNTYSDCPQSIRNAGDDGQTSGCSRCTIRSSIAPKISAIPFRPMALE